MDGEDPRARSNITLYVLAFIFTQIFALSSVLYVTRQYSSLNKYDKHSMDILIGAKDNYSNSAKKRHISENIELKRVTTVGNNTIDIIYGHMDSRIVWFAKHTNSPNESYLINNEGDIYFSVATNFLAK